MPQDVPRSTHLHSVGVNATTHMRTDGGTRLCAMGTGPSAFLPSLRGGATVQNGL